MSNKRKDGFYICEIDYECMRTIMYWDEDDQCFYGPGSKTKTPASFFAYVSKDPIDMEGDVEMIKTGKAWGEDDWKPKGKAAEIVRTVYLGKDHK